jgi:hypothetical protein
MEWGSWIGFLKKIFLASKLCHAAIRAMSEKTSSSSAVSLMTMAR